LNKGIEKVPRERWDGTSVSLIKSTLPSHEEAVAIQQQHENNQVKLNIKGWQFVCSLDWNGL
jgi:hypothetical protein